MVDLFGEEPVPGVCAVQVADDYEAQCTTCKVWKSRSSEEDLSTWIRIHVLDTGHTVRSSRKVTWQHSVEGP